MNVKEFGMPLGKHDINLGGNKERGNEDQIVTSLIDRERDPEN